MSAPLIVYIATGQKYIAEAAISAASCRRHIPDCRIHLYTPDATTATAFDAVVPFGREIRDPFRLKIAGIAAVDAPRYVFLDTDTYALADFSEIDGLLDRFDIAAAQAPVRLQSHLWPEAKRFVEAAPDSFPEFNTGVLAIRQSAKVTAVLGQWLSQYEIHMTDQFPPRTQDQASFRNVVYHSDLRIATLPPEYNCRFPYPASLCGPVKLLHGHGTPEQLEEIGRKLNRNRGFRLITKERFLQHSLIIRDLQRAKPSTRA